MEAVDGCPLVERVGLRRHLPPTIGAADDEVFLGLRSDRGSEKDERAEKEHP